MKIKVESGTGKLTMTKQEWLNIGKKFKLGDKKPVKQPHLKTEAVAKAAKPPQNRTKIAQLTQPIPGQQPQATQPPQVPQPNPSQTPQLHPADQEALAQIKLLVHQMSQEVGSMQPGDINNAPKITAKLKMLEQYIPKLKK